MISREFGEEIGENAENNGRTAEFHTAKEPL